MGRYEIDFLPEYTDEALLSELRRIASLLPSGRRLTQAEYRRLSGRASRVTFMRRFGGWKQALERAGLFSIHGFYPQLTSELTEQQCLENLASVWTHYARAPQYREMFHPPSRIKGKTYITRWGTWRKALVAFAKWAESEGETGRTTPEVEQSSANRKRVTQAARAEADCREVRPGLRFKVFMRDRFRCIACGRSPATHLNIVLHADHILAVTNGGKTMFDNLQTLCQDCNLGKGRAVVL